MISLVVGRQGSGKTLFLVLRALQAAREGRRVYSNVHLRGIKYVPIRFSEIIECKYSNGVLLLDEAHLYLPARAALSKKSRLIVDGFLSMVRKKRLDVLGSTQLERKIDVRFREEKDYLFVCSKFLNVGGRWVECVGARQPSGEVVIRVDALDCFSQRMRSFAFGANVLYQRFDTDQIIRVDDL